MRKLLTAFAFVVLAACASGSDGTRTSSLIVDSSNLPVAGERGWNFERTWSLDLDGDQERERVVLLSQVERRGESFLWEDAQRWVVYVEEPDGNQRRTYVFSQNVPMGRVDVFTTQPEPGRDPRIILLQTSGTSLALWEVQYRGRGNVDVSRILERSLDAATYVGGSSDR